MEYLIDAVLNKIKVSKDEENHFGHMKMWMLLGMFPMIHTERGYHLTQKDEVIDGYIPHACFACREGTERAVQVNGSKCAFCPIDWSASGDPQKLITCESDGTLYTRYMRTSGDPKRKSELAFEIAQMPWKNEDGTMDRVFTLREDWDKPK